MRGHPVGGVADLLLGCDHHGFVVFCFAKPEDARTFAERFGNASPR
jgi:hypothetical protein